LWSYHQQFVHCLVGLIFYLIVTNLSSFLHCLIQSVIAEVPDILLKCVNRDEAALAVAQKVNHFCFVMTLNCKARLIVVLTIVFLYLVSGFQQFVRQCIK
jgi:hypothetical protein